MQAFWRGRILPWPENPDSRRYPRIRLFDQGRRLHFEPDDSGIWIGAEKGWMLPFENLAEI